MTAKDAKPIRTEKSAYNIVLSSNNRKCLKVGC